MENSCKFRRLHEAVCDLCHKDAHIQNFLPAIVETEKSMNSEIESLMYRVAMIRSEFQAKVVDDIIHIERPDIQAMRDLSEEVARLNDLIDETKTKSEKVVAANEARARRFGAAFEKSGLGDVLGEPPTRLYVDFRDNSILINGKSVVDAIVPAGDPGVQAWRRFIQELSDSDDERDG